MPYLYGIILPHIFSMFFRLLETVIALVVTWL